MVHYSTAVSKNFANCELLNSYAVPCMGTLVCDGFSSIRLTVLRL